MSNFLPTARRSQAGWPSIPLSGSTDFSHCSRHQNTAYRISYICPHINITHGLHKNQQDLRATIGTVAHFIHRKSELPTCEQVTRCWVRVEESKQASTFSTPDLSSIYSSSLQALGWVTLHGRHEYTTLSGKLDRISYSSSEIIFTGGVKSNSDL